MADPVKKQTPKAVEDFLTNVRKKTVRQLVVEDRKALNEEVKKTTKPPAEPPPPPASEPPKPPPPEEVKKEIKKELPEVNIEEVVTKTATEVAKEIRKIDQDKKLTEEEKHQKQEELKAHWTGMDKTTGQVTPRDYDEIVKESRRLAYEDFKEFYKEQKNAELEEYKKVQAEEETRKKSETESYQTRVAYLNKRINSEMEELYAAGKMEKPADISDLKDPKAKKVKDLFDQAIKYNESRKAEGKDLEPSIAKFFFMYYKPGEDNQPAGEDAPIAGNRSAPPENTDRFNYARDIRNKSFKQILYEARQKLRGANQ